jgi:hypothetical protein
MTSALICPAGFWRQNRSVEATEQRGIELSYRLVPPLIGLNAILLSGDAKSGVKSGQMILCRSRCLTTSAGGPRKWVLQRSTWSG